MGPQSVPHQCWTACPTTAPSDRSVKDHSAYNILEGLYLSSTHGCACRHSDFASFLILYIDTHLFLCQGWKPPIIPRDRRTYSSCSTPLPLVTSSAISFEKSQEMPQLNKTSLLKVKKKKKTRPWYDILRHIKTY